jgi:hypothetical protein
MVCSVDSRSGSPRRQAAEIPADRRASQAGGFLAMFFYAPFHFSSSISQLTSRVSEKSFRRSLREASHVKGRKQSKLNLEL